MVVLMRAVVVDGWVAGVWEVVVVVGVGAWRMPLALGFDGRCPKNCAMLPWERPGLAFAGLGLFLVLLLSLVVVVVVVVSGFGSRAGAEAMYCRAVENPMDMVVCGAEKVEEPLIVYAELHIVVPVIIIVVVGPPCLARLGYGSPPGAREPSHRIAASGIAWPSAVHWSSCVDGSDTWPALMASADGRGRRRISAIP